ncbi:hypothetical protein BDL97_15G022200, partial [Sphagnum fallax]
FTISPQDIARLEANPQLFNNYGGTKGVSTCLRINPQEGIQGTPEDIQLRVDAFGTNTYVEREPKIFLEYLWEACQDQTLIILVVCAIVSLIVGLTTESLSTGWYDGGGITFAVVLVLMVSSVSEYKQAQKFQELNKQKRKILINVTRGGRRIKISIFDLVVGDLVQLNIGDQIPGDGLLMQGHSMLVDESSMTGESDPIAIDEIEHPFLLSGCKVMDGCGDMIVTAVGMSTEWGRLMATISEDNDEDTPLQVRLNSLATTIGKVGLAVAGLVFSILVIRFLSEVDFKHFTGDDGNTLVDYFAIAVTIVVVAVPEGLPLAVTLTLAYSMAKMMDDRALVRHLSACETMGSATTICSDKTGTLTMNMTRDGKTCVHWKGAAEIMLELCTHTLEADGSITPLTPDKMEQLNATISKFANSALRTLCFAYRDVSPSEVEELAIKTTKLPDQNLICIAIVGIKDPCRFGVPESVARCQQAGIKVRMVTGDNLQTAKAIAEECGICTEGGIAIEGKTFRAMTIEQQYNVIPSIDVMARSSPSDKHILVKRLLERGEIVAVTGDGTNDAPALHEASIGLAMGIAGTEVAKESSDIIILDDNFASIVKVVRWGRSIYCNIQKFIQFQTTVNGVALSLNFITAIASGNAPLTAVQLLWVNLIMDTLGALALATEQPTESLMLRPPIGVDEPLITNIMWRNIVGQSLYQLLLLLVLHFKGLVILGLNDKTDRNMSQVTGPGLQTNSEKVLQTIIFNAFVFCQVFNEINARKPDKINVLTGLFSNHLFLYVISFTSIAQVLIVEFAGNFTSTVKLDWQMWILCLILGVFSMPLAMLIKLIPVPDAPFITYLMPWRE